METVSCNGERFLRFGRLNRRPQLPSVRQHCLRKHGCKGLFNESFFIVRGGDEDVLHILKYRLTNQSENNLSPC